MIKRVIQKWNRPRILLGVIIVSDRCARGERQDRSGPIIAEWARQVALDLVASETVPDDAGKIQAHLLRLTDQVKVDLLLTSGGTGLGPRDVTPEATLDVIERAVPGIPEMLRTATGKANPKAALSRAVAGLRGKTFIVNLPGHPKAVKEWLQHLAPLLPHAFEMVEGKTHEEARHLF